MPIKLKPEEVRRFVKEVDRYFRHYHQYDNFFEQNGILFYTECREYGKRGGFDAEFSKYEDSTLLTMLKAMKVYIEDYIPESEYDKPNKSFSLQLIDALIVKNFEDIHFSVPSNTTETLMIVLEEANDLITQQKYPLAIDRVHTFFQHYLRRVCKVNEIEVDDECSMKDAMLALINQHPYFEDILREEEIKNIFKSLCNMCDRFDTFRNHHSLAHPTDLLLKKNEAKLMINVVRTLYSYFEGI